MKNCGDLENDRDVELGSTGWRKPIIALAIALIVLGTPAWVSGSGDGDTGPALSAVTTIAP